MEDTTTRKIKRPPVVVVMGHVDHGKTTLLDAIRKTEVAAREYGGITQKIGAYQVTIDGNTITFIDTPGHEAFTKMRSQGANVADTAILVVAANDSVKPQTVESIKIIKAAKIPFIVAINKVDLAEANTDKTISDLGRHEVALENYGGDTPFVKVSALKGDGVKELLELVSLVAEMNEIDGDPAGELAGTAIEAKLDVKRGPVATVIIKNGTLKVGETVFVGSDEVKIKALIDYLGKPLQTAGPGTPAEILGAKTVPAVGARIGKTATVSEKAAAGKSDQEENTDEKLKVIIRTDTIGSLEAITAALPPNVDVKRAETGEINEDDILLAKTVGAIVLGFNTKASTSATSLAESEKVLLRTYKIIYELLDEVRDAAAGMIEKLMDEEVLGVGQVLAEFPFEKLRIAGVKVLDGRIARGDNVRISRRDEEIGTAKVKSIRGGKEEVSKVEKGKECGILLEPQIDFRPGDDIISYRLS
jgi:translation initiation factor IF-2